MTLGRTSSGAIKVKTGGGLRAVSCGCCGSISDPCVDCTPFNGTLNLQISGGDPISPDSFKTVISYYDFSYTEGEITFYRDGEPVEMRTCGYSGSILAIDSYQNFPDDYNYAEYHVSLTRTAGGFWGGFGPVDGFPAYMTPPIALPPSTPCSWLLSFSYYSMSNDGRWCGGIEEVAEGFSTKVISGDDPRGDHSISVPSGPYLGCAGNPTLSFTVKIL